jgi:hypothetical protein
MQIIYLILALFLTSNSFITFGKPSYKNGVFSDSSLKNLNVRGIRPGSSEQKILSLIYENYRDDYIYGVATSLYKERSDSLRFLLSGSKAFSKTEALTHFTVIQHIASHVTLNVDQDNTHYLIRFDNGSSDVGVISLPYPMVFVDGEKLQAPKDWFSKGGYFEYDKIFANDNDLSRVGRQRIQIYELLKDDKLQLLSSSGLDDKDLKKKFVDELKNGSTFETHINNQKVDCRCADGRVFSERTSLHTDIISCSNCSGRGYHLRQIRFVTSWSNDLPSGISNY